MSAEPMDGRCGRLRSNGIDYCEKAPVRGLDCCATHGGATKRSKAKAARVVAETEVVREMARLGHPVPAGPLHDVMLACVDAAWGDVLFYRTKVAELDDVTGEDTGPGGAHYETVRAVVKLYTDAQAWLAKVTKMAIDVGVDERKIRVTETMGATIVEILRASALELGMADDPRFGEVVARHLRAVGE